MREAPLTTIGVGDYVLDSRYGRQGRVIQVHYSCPESPDWLEKQSLTTRQKQSRRWLSVLVHDGGSMVAPEETYVKLEPFEFKNRDAQFYFGREA